MADDIIELDFELLHGLLNNEGPVLRPFSVRDSITALKEFDVEILLGLMYGGGAVPYTPRLIYASGLCKEFDVEQLFAFPGLSNTSVVPPHLQFGVGSLKELYIGGRIPFAGDSLTIIEVVAEPIVANFSSALRARSLEVVDFTDLSTSTPTFWLWDFGDGYFSTLQNPSHSYAAPGVYTVVLFASNEESFDYEVKYEYITVFTLDASFSVDPLFLFANSGSINFLDTSLVINTEIASWYYSFGDFSFSSAQNPTHFYVGPRTFIVSLIITDIYGFTSTFIYPDKIFVTKEYMADMSNRANNLIIEEVRKQFGVNPAISEFPESRVGGLKETEAQTPISAINDLADRAVSLLSTQVSKQLGVDVSEVVLPSFNPSVISPSQSELVKITDASDRAAALLNSSVAKQYGITPSVQVLPSAQVGTTLPKVSLTPTKITDFGERAASLLNSANSKQYGASLASEVVGPSSFKIVKQDFSKISDLADRSNSLLISEVSKRYGTTPEQEVLASPTGAAAAIPVNPEFSKITDLSDRATDLLNNSIRRQYGPG